MQARIATLVCLIGIYYLFRGDRKKNGGVSKALWIPLIWMLFAGSRFPSDWLNLGSPSESSVEKFSEGSPLDRNIFLVLVLTGTWVLRQRMLNWPLILSRNTWVWLFILYSAMSILWSDDPFISLKRWVKGFGNIVMALIIITEHRPYDALGFVLRRLGFVLIPLSVLFVRYYPDLGRGYHMGIVEYSGVTTTKNSLGQLCLIVGIYFCWQLFVLKLKPATLGNRPPYFVYLIMLTMTAWLLHISHSATSLALMISAACFLLVVRLPSLVKKPRRILSLLITLAVVFAFLEGVFGIKEHIIEMLGRDPDLTERTPVWAMLMEMVDNHLFGVGYEIFWYGDRLTWIWQRMGTPSNGIVQAHNGYLEIYLSLGIVGLILLVGGIIAGLVKALKHLETEYAYGVLRIILILTIVVYNYTEATFVPLSNMFILLFVSILEAPILSYPKKYSFSKPKKIR